MDTLGIKFGLTLLKAPLSPSESTSSSESSTPHASLLDPDLCDDGSVVHYHPPPGAEGRRRPIPRKGHKKSRKGCFNCKRRKVKCPETLPECANCKRNGLVCEYPPEPSKLVLSPSLQSTPTVFSMDDLRLFQHFLFKAYPPLPILGDSIWRDVAQFSHSFDYLIHAMLGLAASHLSLCGGADFSAEALSHRVTAIKLLNRSLSRPCASRTEGDARYAAMMALTFQSSYMADGMLDFVSMSRGCHVVAASAMPSFDESLFASFSGEGHYRAVKSLGYPRASEPQEDAFAVAFLGSLRGLAPLCQSTLEVNFMSQIERALNVARISSVDAFGEVGLIYHWMGVIEQDEFLSLVSTTNYTAQLLMIHFFVLEYAIANIAFGTSLANFAYRKHMNVIWIERLFKVLPKKYQGHLRWPMEYARRVVYNPLVLADNP